MLNDNQEFEKIGKEKEKFRGGDDDLKMMLFTIK